MTLDNAIAHATLNIMDTIKKEKQQRTPKQNASLHLFFQMTADSLNEAGYSVQKIIKQSMDINWSPHLVKELLWRGAQNAMLGKISTTELTTDEVSKIYEQLNLYLSEKFGIFVCFPSEDELANQQL